MYNQIKTHRYNLLALQWGITVVDRGICLRFFTKI